MSGVALAQLSNNLVYSSMAVYACALVAFAAHVAGLLRLPAARVVQERGLVAASTGAGIAAPERPSDFAAASSVAVADADGDDDAEVPPAAARLGRIGMSLTIAAFGLHAAAVLARAVSAGRVPWGNMYEFALTGALAATAVFLLLARRMPVGYLGVVLIPGVLLGLGVAVTVLYTESAELVPALKSVWLIIHVVAMVVSFGALTVGAALSGLYLARRSARFGPRLQRLPSAERLDTTAYQLHAFVFPLYTFAVLAGAVWAENAWGRYWGWDPKETWAFIVWVVYAAYLHARVTAGWRGGRAAGIALLGYACFLFNLFGINYLVSGLHSYAG